MKQLAPREEQIMQIIWQQNEVFIRDIVDLMPEPKPHYNTMATIVKILVEKGFLKSELVGNTHQYSPSIPFETYREQHVGDIKKKYFGNSFPKMLAHFAKNEKLSEAEVNELLEIIKNNK